jgi:hypothetical protein
VQGFFEPILVVLLGQYSYNYLFEILLIFILLASVIYIALGKVPLFKDQKSVRWILTIVIPLLGVRFIDYESLITILQSYQLLAIVITCVLPFIIYFYFIYNAAGDHGIIRKLGWALWIVVYLGLWSSSYSSDLNSMIYFWTFIAGILLILFDGMIWRRYSYIQLHNAGKLNKSLEVGKINMEIQNIQAMITRGAIDAKEGQKFIKRLMDDKEFIEKNL